LPADFNLILVLDQDLTSSKAVVTSF